MDRHEAITQSYAGIARRIVVPVRVANDKGESKEYPGLIDTGATNTSVSREVAAEMQLVSVGEIDSGTAAGKTKANVYVVDLSLCGGRMHFPKHKVLSANLTEQPGVEMLIGMDILNHGDFALTNYQGKTVATFRIPSQGSLNFVPTAINANKFAEEQARREANQVGKKNKHKRKRA